MHPIRKKRLWLIIGLLCGCGLAVGLVLLALQKNINLFYTPTQVSAGEAPLDRTFRLGGLVKTGSVERSDEGLLVHFIITDGAQEVAVAYDGILPDLFRAGQGIVTLGRLTAPGHFQAEEVLAKHDENYMPPEAAYALKQARQGGS